MFPDTPQTLLRKIAELAQGDDRAEWEAFVELYEPPLRQFIRTINGALTPEAVDDAVQEIFIRLVDVLRQGQIDRKKGKFRAYLASMTRRLLIDRYREALVRPVLGEGQDAVDATSSSRQREEEHSDFSHGSVTTADPGVLFDVRWRVALHAAAVDHVLTKTAISEQSKRIYALLQRGLSLRETAERMGVSYDVIKQVKFRIDRAVEAVERRSH